MPDVKFSNLYPYTDFHELNLDWVIKEVKFWSERVGKSIQKIEKTGTVGLIDTYTITYSDGSTSTFDVTNGNGIASVAKTGTAGLVDTYTITFQDGSTSTFTVTNGTAAVVQTLGSSITDVMSQKTVTENFATNIDLNNFSLIIPDLLYGTNTIVTNNNNQWVFDQLPPKRYMMILYTDTEVTISSIQTRTTSNAASETLGSNVLITTTNPFIAILNPTSTINRVRLTNPSVSANITMRIIDVADLNKALSSAIKELTYMADFSVNQLDGQTWTVGYGLSSSNTNRPSVASGYSILYVSAKKGDILISINQAGHELPSNYASIAEAVDYGTDKGFRGIVWGNGSYILPYDMNLVLCKTNNYNTFYWYSSAAYAESNTCVNDKYIAFPEENTTKISAVTYPAGNNHNAAYPRPFSFVHLSDIHDNMANFAKLRYFKEKFKSYVNDFIHTGDQTGNSFYNYMPVLSQDDYKDIMVCIGNHDVYDRDGNTTPYDDPSGWATPNEKYDTYIKPGVSGWNVTQPTNAETNGLCYYFKDYTQTVNGIDYKLRLIVLDGMAYDAAQHSWLVSVLTDANTNGFEVMIANHFPPILGAADISGYNTPFMSKLTGMEFAYSTSRLSIAGSYATDAVDNFITAGGTFICWICGHMHYDQVATLVSHPNQIYIAVGSANRSTNWADMPRPYDTDQEDLYNIISIDPYYKLIKVTRIGAKYDDWNQHRGGFTIDYSNRQLITTW